MQIDWIINGQLEIIHMVSLPCSHSIELFFCHHLLLKRISGFISWLSVNRARDEKRSVVWHEAKTKQTESRRIEAEIERNMRNFLLDGQLAVCVCVYLYRF